MGSSAGITGGGDCRGDWRRRALTPTPFPPVTPALSSTGNALSRPLSQLLHSFLWSHRMRGSGGSQGSDGEGGGLADGGGGDYPMP